MAKWRILREKPAPKKEHTADLSSRTKFMPTGKTFEGDHAAAEAHRATLETEQGGCFALEEIRADA